MSRQVPIYVYNSYLYYRLKQKEKHLRWTDFTLKTNMDDWRARVEGGRAYFVRGKVIAVGHPLVEFADV